jgi:hypothetical protein
MPSAGGRGAEPTPDLPSKTSFLGAFPPRDRPQDALHRRTILKVGDGRIANESASTMELPLSHNWAFSRRPNQAVWNVGVAALATWTPFEPRLLVYGALSTR